MEPIYKSLVNAVATSGKEIIVQLLEKVRIQSRDARKTLLLTDPRCLDHAGFDQYHNITKRSQQKDEQPENAERLMVLIDKERGVLTQSEDLLEKGICGYIVKEEVAKPAALSEVFRVHDYNYLMKVMEMASKLEFDENPKSSLMRYGNQLYY